MANRFWTLVERMLPGRLARARDVNDNLEGIETGFNDVEAEIDAIDTTLGTAMTIPSGADFDDSAITDGRASKIAAFDADDNPVLFPENTARQNKVLGYDSAGELTLYPSSVVDGLNQQQRYEIDVNIAIKNGGADLLTDVWTGIAYRTVDHVFIVMPGYSQALSGEDLAAANNIQVSVDFSVLTELAPDTNHPAVTGYMGSGILAVQGVTESEFKEINVVFEYDEDTASVTFRKPFSGALGLYDHGVSGNIQVIYLPGTQFMYRRASA